MPALGGRVVDTADTLTPVQVASLDQQLGELEQDTGAQVAILIVESTAPEDIADYTQRVADQWKLGRRDVGDGVLIVLAVKDRRVRIAVAKALEGAIPDLAAKRVITETMAPRFQGGDYAAGLRAGVARLGTLIRQEGLPAPASGAATSGSNDQGQGWWFPALISVLALSSVLRAVFGRKGGAVLTGGAAGLVTGLVSGSWGLALGVGIAAAVAALVFGASSLLRGLSGSRRGPVIWGSGGGGWGGGGGGGGGWHSGGGGDFGGGGASGNW